MVLSVSQSTRDGSISLAARLSTSVAPCHDGESLITVFMAINPSPALARGALNSRLDGFSTQPLRKFSRPSSSSARGAITACEVFCMSNFPQYLVASPQFGTICWDRKGVIFPCRDKTRGNILALRIFRSVPATAARLAEWVGGSSGFGSYHGNFDRRPVGAQGGRPVGTQGDGTPPHGLPTGACARAMVALPSGSPLSSRKVEADNRVTVPGMAPKRTAVSQMIEPSD